MYSDNGWISRRTILGGQRALTVLAVVCLAACSPATDDARLGDYLTRVARLVERDPDLSEPEPGPRYPERRELRLAIPRESVSIGEFIALHDCDAGALVGYRNSPLGRTQSASQRLGYEAELLAALARCGEAREAWMDRLAAEKSARLPALFWNATFAERELATAMRGGRSESGSSDRGQFAFQLRALGDHLTDLEAGRLELREFERTLRGLAESGQVDGDRRQWRNWRRHFDAVSGLLEGAGERLCRAGAPTPRARYMHNVFRRYYVEGIQPDLARSAQIHEAWIAALDRLLIRLAPVVPDEFDRWADSVFRAGAASEWGDARRALLDHAAAWGVFFDACGLDPGAAVRQD